MRFYILFSGTTVHPSDPGYATRPEAQAALKEAWQHELAYAKRRGWRHAYCSHTKDSFEIRAGKPSQCPLWTRGAVVSF